MGCAKFILIFTALAILTSSFLSWQVGLGLSVALTIAWELWAGWRERMAEHHEAARAMGIEHRFGGGWRTTNGNGHNKED